MLTKKLEPRFRYGFVGIYSFRLVDLLTFSPPKGGPFQSLPVAPLTLE